MSEFTIIHQAQNLSPIGGSPYSSPYFIDVADPLNTNYQQPGYTMPSDDNDGTDTAPFATFARAVQELGKIVDAPVIIRMHNMNHDPVAPAALGPDTGVTVEQGEWDLDIVGGNGKVAVVGDLMIALDKTSSDTAEDGSATAVCAAIMDKSVSEGCIWIDIADSTLWPVSGWGGGTHEFNPEDDTTIENSWLEWVDGGGTGNTPGTYRAKVFCIDLDGGGGGIDRYYLQHPDDGILAGVPDVAAGSLRLVKCGYRLQNPVGVDQFAVLHINPYRHGHGGFVPGDRTIEVAEVLPPVVLHGLDIRNSTVLAGTRGAQAIRGGGFMHIMLKLSAEAHVFLDSISNVDTPDAAMPGIDASQDAGSCLYLTGFNGVVSDNKHVRFENAKGLVKMAIYPAGNTNVEVWYGADTVLTVEGEMCVYEVGPGLKVPLRRTVVDRDASLRVIGPYTLGEAFAQMTYSEVISDGFPDDWNVPNTWSAMALISESLPNQGRLTWFEMSKCIMNTGQIALDQPAGVATGMDRQGAYTGGRSVIRVFENAEVVIGEYTGCGMYYINEPAAVDYAFPMLEVYGRVINRGRLELSSINPGGAGGYDFGNNPAIVCGHDGTFENLDNSTIEIQNSNAGTTDQTQCSDGSKVSYDGYGQIAGTAVILDSAGADATAIIGATGGIVLTNPGFSNEQTAGAPPAVAVSDLRSLIETT